MQTNRQTAIRRLTQLALLTAVQLVMTFTPLGLVPLGPINASLLSIPVATGAMLLGPAAFWTPCRAKARWARRCSRSAPSATR